jgi:hypothetical protein
LDGEAAQREAGDEAVGPDPTPDLNKGGALEYLECDEDQPGDEEVREESTHKLDGHVHEAPVRRAAGALIQLNPIIWSPGNPVERMPAVRM